MVKRSLLQSTRLATIRAARALLCNQPIANGRLSASKSTEWACLGAMKPGNGENCKALCPRPDFMGYISISITAAEYADVLRLRTGYMNG
jgi:hypothetical protein